MNLTIKLMVLSVVVSRVNKDLDVKLNEMTKIELMLVTKACQNIFATSLYTQSALRLLFKV